MHRRHVPVSLPRTAPAHSALSAAPDTTLPTPPRSASVSSTPQPPPLSQAPSSVSTQPLRTPSSSSSESSTPPSPDPLHDPDADSDDDLWVRTHLEHSNVLGHFRVSCPCCFTMLAMQCTPTNHPGHFRTTSVINLRVDARPFVQAPLALRQCPALLCAQCSTPVGAFATLTREYCFLRVLY